MGWTPMSLKIARQIQIAQTNFQLISGECEHGTKEHIQRGGYDERAEHGVVKICKIKDHSTNGGGVANF